MDIAGHRWSLADMYGPYWTPVVVGGHAWVVLDTSGLWRTYMDIARRWRTYKDNAERWRTYMDISGHKWSLADKYGVVWTITGTVMVRGQQWTSVDRPFWGPTKNLMNGVYLSWLGFCRRFRVGRRFLPANVGRFPGAEPAHPFL